MTSPGDQVLATVQSGQGAHKYLASCRARVQQSNKQIHKQYNSGGLLGIFVKAYLYSLTILSCSISTEFRFYYFTIYINRKYRPTYFCLSVIVPVKFDVCD